MGLKQETWEYSCFFLNLLWTPVNFYGIFGFGSTFDGYFQNLLDMDTPVATQEYNMKYVGHWVNLSSIRDGQQWSYHIISLYPCQLFVATSGSL